MNPVTFEVNDVVVIKYAQKYWFQFGEEYEQHDLKNYYGNIGVIQRHKGGRLFLELKHPSGPTAHYALHWFDFDKIGVL